MLIVLFRKVRAINPHVPIQNPFKYSKDSLYKKTLDKVLGTMLERTAAYEERLKEGIKHG